MTGKAKAKGGWFRRVDPLTSLILVFPLFLLYEVGILLVPAAYNGADLITAEIVHLLHGRVGLYIALNAALWTLFLGLVLWARGRYAFDRGRLVSVLLESTLYALTMGSLICFVMIDLLHVDPRLALLPVLRAGEGAAPGLLGGIVISLGAGVHEELVFRVILVGGVSAALMRVFRVRGGIAVASAFIVSSLLFSAAHHIVGGEAFRIGTFVYRVLCGLFFASLYQWRGLAVAVYTHALYDIYVIVVRG